MALEEIKTYISKSDLDSAILNLKSHIEKSHKHLSHELILIEGKFSDLRKKERIGIISNEEQNLSRNKIAYELINIIAQIEKSREKEREVDNDSIGSSNQVIQLPPIEKNWWDNYPLIKELLIRLGFVEIKDIRDFDSFCLTKYVELKKKKSISEIIQFFQIEVEKNKKDNHLEKKIRRLEYNLVVADSLLGNDKFKAKFSENDISRLRELKLAALDDFNSSRKKRDKTEYEIREQEERERINLKVKENINLKKVKLSEKVVKIPMENASSLLIGYLWSVYGCPSPNEFPKAYKSKGDWVNIGDEIFTFIKSPANGIISDYVSKYNIEIIPTDDFEIPNNVGELIFGELISRSEEAINKKLDPRGSGLEYKAELVELLKKTELLIEGLNNETSDYFDYFKERKL